MKYSFNALPLRFHGVSSPAHYFWYQLERIHKTPIALIIIIYSFHRLLKDYENADTELLIYATSLINKTLSGLSDQDSYYDESDYLEQQGMEGVVQRYMSRPGTDLDLLDQLQLYEAVLKWVVVFTII